MKTIIFLHGFFASGSCVPANALREAFANRMRVLTPDLPIHPQEALRLIRKLCNDERPDLLVGNSCGSFYAQIIASETGTPALLGNPYFIMTDFLRQRIGKHQYKSPRADGNQNFVIDEQLISEFQEVEKIQFRNAGGRYKDRVWAIFGEQDTLARFEPLYLKYYHQTTHFPGAHTPTASETKAWHVPLIEKILTTLQHRE